MKVIFTTIPILCLGLASMSAQANAGPHLSCNKTGSFSWGCRVANPQVHEPLSFRGEVVDTSYRLDYAFECLGHDMKLRVASEGNSAALAQGTGQSHLQVEGSAPLVLVDDDPARTARLIFSGACDFVVADVWSTPSSSARQTWAQSAQAQASTLRNLKLLFLLATDYEALASWTQDKLSAVRDRLERLVERFPRNVHYKVLLRTVQSAMDGTPSTHPEVEIAQAAETLAQTYRLELERELEVANLMVERFRHFRLAIHAELQAALDEVEDS